MLLQASDYLRVGLDIRAQERARLEEERQRREARRRLFSVSL